jgi:hypothetical protein
MRSSAYRDKVAVGGVWPGFDDSLAPWGSGRFVARHGDEVCVRTRRLASRHRPPVVLIGTFNDHEEGTDVEHGVPMVVDMEEQASAILMRSSPFEVVWDPARGEAVLQVYGRGRLLHDQRHEPGVFVALRSGEAYEVKPWVAGCPEPLARTVKVRAQDPIPGVTPIDVD